METYYIKEYIKETQALLDKKKVVLYFPCLFLSAVGLLLSTYAMHNIGMARFIIGYNAPIIVALLAGIVFSRHDWLILGYALMFTGTSASLAVLGFYGLNPDKVTVLCCLALYMVACALRVACVKRSVRSGRYFAKERAKTLPWVWLGIPAVVLGQVIARVMVGALSYETNHVIFLCLLIVFIFLFALGSHFYLCFYYMRKYKVR
jgi:hypothetical protein